MKIKKLSHCCLVIETNGKKILLDPGSYSVEEHRKLHNIDIILFTHEHNDHFHIESLRELVKAMPHTKIIANDAVGAMLVKEGIEHLVMEHGNKIDIGGIHIEAFGKKHALLHSSIPPVSNVGFFLENKLFFPGDAFTIPEFLDAQKPANSKKFLGSHKIVDVLALPVCGPWMKISEAIDYALAIKPRIAFPVHDAVRSGAAYRFPEMILPKNGIEFIKLEEGGEIEIE